MAEQAGFGFDPNAYGLSAAGQEGSGMNQILTPYDATKFDRAIVAAGEKNKEDKAKAMKEAKAFKPPDFEKLTTPWVNDAKLLSRELYQIEQDTLANEMQYYKNISEIKDPDALYEANLQVATDRAKINSRYRKLEDEVQMGLVNQKIADDAIRTFDGNSTLFDAGVTKHRIEEFSTLKGREDLIEQYGIQGARDYLLREEYGGSLLKDKFNYNKHQAERINVNQSMGHESSWGWATKNVEKGLLYRSESSEKIYDLNEIKQAEISVLRDYDTYQEWIKNDRFRDEILDMFGADSPSQITKEQVIEFAEKSPEFEQYVKVELMPRDIIKYSESATQLREDAAGSRIMTTDEIMQTTDMVKTADSFFNPAAKAVAEFMGKDYGEGWGNVWAGGAHELTNADVKQSTDATLPLGEYTVYLDPLTGDRVTNITGNTKRTSPGVQAIQMRLYKDVRYNGRTIKAGEYINEDIANKLGLKVGLDYDPVNVNTSQVEGVYEEDIRDKDGKKTGTNTKTKKMFATVDYLEDSNLTGLTKQNEFENERIATAGFYTGKSVKLPNNSAIDAYSLIEQRAAELGGGKVTPENFRQAKLQFNEDLSNGTISYVNY